MALAGIAASLTLAITLLERLLGEGWRSMESIASSFLLIAFGLLPSFAGAKLQMDEKRATGTGLMAGGIAGLAYGLVVRSILPSAFFGACVGAGEAFLAQRWISTGGTVKHFAAVGAALVVAHALGLLPPTKVERPLASDTIDGRNLNDKASPVEAQYDQAFIAGQELGLAHSEVPTQALRMHYNNLRNIRDKAAEDAFRGGPDSARSPGRLS